MLSTAHLTSKQLAILEFIEDHGPCNPHDVAERFGLTYSTAGVYLHKLRKQYLLVPERSDPDDKYPKWKVRPGVRIEPSNKSASISRPFDTMLIQASSIWCVARRCAA